MNSYQQIFQNIKSNSTLIYCLQILIVLTGTTLGLYFLGYEQLIVPITLGAIATALTDFDDRLSIRLRNLGLVCVLFFTVSSILDFLHPYKLLFLIYLSLSSAAFILMGALGQRYATISFGTVLLSIYTMFGLGEYTEWYQQPSYFVMGTLWYGLTSIIFYLLKPTQAVQDNLSNSFNLLSELLMSKAKLFDPDNVDNVEQLLYDLSLQNSQLVQNLNQTKASLLTRLKASRANKNTIYWLNLYFLAQDIHEQVTSNYLHYEKIHQNFSRTDLIYRIQKNVRLQARNCRQLAEAILKRQIFQTHTDNNIALAHLENSMQEWIQHNPHNLEVKNLLLVLNNLKNVQDQFINLSIEQRNYQQSYSQHRDNLNLLDDDIHDLPDLWLKIKQHLTPNSALFRHAVRIAFVFAVGYTISLLPFAKNGYWILLTSLFVCQISYFATKSRLKLRTLGTVLGVLLGIPILYFVPSIEGQLLLTIIFGVYFFYLRSKKYAMATLMATLMVLLIFNLKGAGYAIILPRIIDTLLGCLIAWFAVSFIWPDWNFRDISNNIRKSSKATLDYFDAVVEQYQQGRTNSIDYRKARRAAHNAQIELSTMISSLSAEPNPNPDLIHNAFRYLVYSHSQLSYVSALGSHREHVHDQQILDLMLWCKHTLTDVLLNQTAVNEALIETKLTEIQHISDQENLSDNLLLVLKQISLLLETLPELLKLKTTLLRLEIK
ncbi:MULTISPECIES: YccS family putative transporter [Acinetobacter]|uniref:YccS family putative transporter n=1 Tax=Acinetobacter TaxID=469 RepID=UPI0004D545C3|nr:MULTISPECIES: YccS family putative transporter [unclassified Acinetobacter]KEC83806.1 membrane protein [Acinetobacter sp. ETR1]WEE39202.1 YccS family putative transporter [Acinetobacter sp. TAC-1]